ncbi:PspC domain-containing protein [Oerskovia sp. M15]
MPGLALHLDLPVGAMRLVMALLALAGGAGIVLYVFLWVTVPAGTQRRQRTRSARPPCDASLLDCSDECASSRCETSGSAWCS